mgnify:CR=1 FL=1
MKERTCKKCGAKLPVWYKPDLCLYCMRKKEHKFKNVGIAVASGLTVGGIALTIIKKATGK